MEKPSHNLEQSEINARAFGEYINETVFGAASERGITLICSGNEVEISPEGKETRIVTIKGDSNKQELLKRYGDLCDNLAAIYDGHSKLNEPPVEIPTMPKLPFLTGTPNPERDNLALTREYIFGTQQITQIAQQRIIELKKEYANLLD